MRERKRQATRRALVEAATTLFLRDGFDETSVAAIARLAGVSPRTFFVHFTAKEDILFHHVERYAELAVAAVDALPDDATPWQAVHAAMIAMIDAADPIGDEADRLAPVRAELARRGHGAPASLVRRLQGLQLAVLEAVRARFGPQTPGANRAAIQLGAAIGAVTAAAVHDQTPDRTRLARRRAMHRALRLAEAGFAPS
ncbi:TetR/AcrR family transcriptional regulator [Microlunatus parietis]|uniref:AcrR family transcriptional regulator n=1 Tax=Microlunatus parietis TaxID=682979 RepID=A0A7Y9LD83_9ACTN|nr:TetR/AcrR family transcriptional regulator [Microlunatus parietis]NYE72628.1 AcrR family transcriptional regulator [Microlunatus parietis]